MTRVGIVGLGSIAGAHVAALRHLAAEGWDIEIAGWAGRPESAAALGLLDLPEADAPGDAAHDHPPHFSSGEPAEAERWRVTVFERLLARDDIDLIVDTSPSGFHGAHALAAIAAGKGIVVEKPLATTPDEAAAVVAAAAASGAFGSVMAQRRFEPQHQWLHRHLRSGALGEVVAASVSLPWWRDDAYFAAASWRGEAPGGSVLLNQAIHSVDLLLWLLGDVARRTTAQRHPAGRPARRRDLPRAPARLSAREGSNHHVSLRRQPSPPPIGRRAGASGRVSGGGFA